MRLRIVLESLSFFVSIKLDIPMKKIILFLSFGICYSFSAQTCNHTIPPAAGGPGGGGIYHIFNDTVINDQAGSIYYICNNVKLTMQYSAGSSYYLENNSTLIITDHDGDVVNAKGNCSITDNSSESIVVNKEASTTFSKPNMPSLAIVYSCSSMNYSYGQVGGASPCSGTLSVVEKQLNKLTVSPNPSNGSLTINLGEYIGKIMVQLTDINGQLILSQTFENEQYLNLEFKASSGIYFLRIQLKDEVKIMKINQE